MSTVQRKDKKGSLAFKLAFFILTGAVVVFLTAFFYDYYYSRKIVMANVEARARNLTRATVNKIESVLQGVEKVNNYGQLQELRIKKGADPQAILQEMVKKVRLNSFDIVYVV